MNLLQARKRGRDIAKHVIVREILRRRSKKIADFLARGG